MMEILSNAHFLRPVWLILAPVAIGLWWLWQRRIEPLRGWREQMDPDLLRALTIDRSAARDHSAGWILAAWLLAIVAVAGPTWRLEPNPFAEDAPPLMILLKADRSMEIADPLPTRLQRAHLKITDLAEVRKGQPLGLIAYAGSAHLVLPPTRDTGVVAEMAAEISPEIMPVAGDRLDLALREAGRILAGEERGGTLLVIADTVASDPQATAAAHESTGSLPLQFLAMTGGDTPESAAMRAAARSMRATVQPLTVDDEDVLRLSRAAARQTAVGIAGESTHWQEAGYWLVPGIALIVAVSFLRQAPAITEGQA